jgi:hypothetical protein
MRTLFAICAALVLAGCYKTEYSETLTEQAAVLDVIYQPSQHGGGMGVGMSMSGNMVVTSNSVDIPAKYAVVFECQHGKFIIEGTGEKHKALWQRLKAGQRVTVTYREQWRVDDKTRTLVKYDFLDAN